MYLNFETNDYYCIIYSVFSNSSAHVYADGQSNSAKSDFNASMQRIHDMSMLIGFYPNNGVFVVRCAILCPL